MEIGVLLIQVTIGVLLVGHGAQKLLGWFGGYGLAGTGGYLESYGFRPGRAYAALAGSAEVVGGSLLALGLATPLAAVLVASTMFVAALTDHRGKGLWIFNGGSEYVLTIAAVSLGFAFSGAGAWSLDAAIGWDVAGLEWGIAALALAALGAGGVLATRGRTLAAPSSSTA